MQKAVYEFISTHTNDPIVEWKTCRRCADDFAITEKEVIALDKISPVFSGKKYSIPTPTLCSHCRLLRRMSFRNEHKLYRRKCDATGKIMVSMFSPESDFTAYDSKYRNEDTRKAEEYAQEPDFSKSFFDQFLQISKKVPKRILSNAVTMVNCEYSNYGMEAKDCYLSAGVIYSERCHYSYSSLKCMEDVDGQINMGCQYTYECVKSLMCYEVYYCSFAISCRNSAFLLDCVGCENCFGCVNLINKKYCFMNKQLTPEEYASKVDSIMGSHKAIEEFKKIFAEFSVQFPRAATRKSKAENCTGDMIANAKNCHNSFTLMNDIHDCKNCFICGETTHDLYDCYQSGAGSQWIYEGAGCSYGYKSAFVCSSDPLESYYIDWVIDKGGSSNLFLCTGLKYKHHYLLNKAYTPESYEKILPQIIEKMQADGERGEFFPLSQSPFPLNDTPAMEYFPIYKVIDPNGKETIFNEKGKGTITILEPEKFISKAILNLGGEKIETMRRTKDIDITAPESLEMISANDLPDNIKDVDDTILDKAIICSISGRPFRLIRQELDFYRKHNIPLPRKHHETRYLERMTNLPPLELFLRNCDKCSTECLAVYDKNYPGKVYCENCYTKEIYG